MNTHPTPPKRFTVSYSDDGVNFYKFQTDDENDPHMRRHAVTCITLNYAISASAVVSALGEKSPHG